MMSLHALNIILKDRDAQTINLYNITTFLMQIATATRRFLLIYSSTSQIHFCHFGRKCYFLGDPVAKSGSVLQGSYWLYAWVFLRFVVLPVRRASRWFDHSFIICGVRAGTRRSYRRRGRCCVRCGRVGVRRHRGSSPARSIGGRPFRSPCRKGNRISYLNIPD